MVRACVSVCNHNRRRVQWWTEMAPFFEKCTAEPIYAEIVEVTLTSSLTQQYKLLTANIACYFLLITSGIQVPTPPPPPPQFL